MLEAAISNSRPREDGMADLRKGFGETEAIAEKLDSL